MSGLDIITNRDVLVGFDTRDDAGVFRINKDQAIVVTADFITPPLDDPYIFGQIAAANSLSDIYAMGGSPMTCLNLMCLPTNELSSDTIQNIFHGALSKVEEADAVIIGGHTVEDIEPKFGLAVTGMVDPDRFWRNSGAQIGDVLILTKSVGSGVIFNGNLKGKVSSQALTACIDELVMLNKKSCEVLQKFPVNAVTDVTGFGLAGHAWEMAKASGHEFTIDVSAVPVFAEAREMYEQGINTKANSANAKLLEGNAHFANRLSPEQRSLMVDPQTSGGLLVALPRDYAEEVLVALHDNGVTSSKNIGAVGVRSKNAKLRFI